MMKSEYESVIIATGADDRFAMPMAVTLYSALANMKRDTAVCLYIFDGGITPENRQRLTDVLNVKHVNVRLEWVRPDLSSLSAVKVTDEFSQAAYIRLLIPERLPHDIDRVIYLDSDLVVERDLGELWKIDVGNSPALAVQDYLYPYVSFLPWAGDTYASRGLAPNTPYCNSGVLVMNLKRWREERIGGEALEYMRQYPQFIRWADQDGINAVLAGNWGLLDPRWNVMLSAIHSYGRCFATSELEMRYAQQELLNDPFILHFTGPIKPWRFRYKGGSQLRFFHYLNLTNWFGSFSHIADLMEHTWGTCKGSDDWLSMLAISAQELDELIPEGDSFILVDNSTWPGGIPEGRRTIPFLEENGHYAGIPANNEVAIREFERLRDSGASFIVFSWPATWWLDHFVDLHHHLRSKFHCVLMNDRLVAFDLRI